MITTTPKQAARAARIVKPDAVTKAIERNQRKTFRARIAGNLTALSAQVHNDIAPALAMLREVDNFIASGQSLMAFARGIVRDVSPWKAVKDASKPALPVGLTMPPNR